MWGVGGRRPGLLSLLQLLRACPASFQTRVCAGEARVRLGAPPSPADIFVGASYPPPLPWALVSGFCLTVLSTNLCCPLVPVVLRPLCLPIGGRPLSCECFVTALPFGLRQLRFYCPRRLCVLTGLSNRGCNLEPSACPTSLLAWGSTRRPSPLLLAGPLPLLCPPAELAS